MEEGADVGSERAERRYILNDPDLIVDRHDRGDGHRLIKLSFEGVEVDAAKPIERDIVE